MLLRNVVQQTSKNVFGNSVRRQSVLLCLSKTRSVNRWSSGNDGGEATANALCKYRKPKWFMGMFSCKKYFGNRHSLLHSTRVSCSKQHRVVVVAAAGAPALPGATRDRRSGRYGTCWNQSVSLQVQIGLQDRGPGCQIYRPITFNLISVSFLC